MAMKVKVVVLRFMTTFTIVASIFRHIVAAGFSHNAVIMQKNVFVLRFTFLAVLSVFVFL